MGIKKDFARFESTVSIADTAYKEGEWQWTARRDMSPETVERGLAPSRAEAWIEGVKRLRYLGPTDVGKPTWDEVMDTRLGDPSNSTVREAVGYLQEEAYARGIAYQATLEDDEPVAKGEATVWCARAPYLVQGGLTEVAALISGAIADPDVFAVVLYTVEDGEPVHLMLDKISAIE
jgi:hypothetical protein